MNATYAMTLAREHTAAEAAEPDCDVALFVVQFLGIWFLSGFIFIAAFSTWKTRARRKATELQGPWL